MRVLVTGTEGYIGARLAPWLTARGHEVVGLDTGFYRDGTLYLDPLGLPQSPRTIYKDLRTVTAADFEGIDAVVHLAELSNDPLGQNRPDITFNINHLGSVRIAQAAREAGVRRLVYASSCSVYGVGATDFVDETSPVNPQTAYAQCKTLVERDLKPMADRSFSVVFLRNATAYGPSPRMRFDIVLNDLCALAWTKKKIAMTSDGSAWRPIVHIEDISRAFVSVLKADPDVVHNEAFNIGAPGENYRVRQIAEMVRDVVPNSELRFAEGAAADTRCYCVNFDKAMSKLKHFHPQWTARKGVEECYDAYKKYGVTLEEFEGPKYQRLAHIRKLIAEGAITKDLKFIQAEPALAS